jgi:hypothetical protein
MELLRLVSLNARKSFGGHIMFTHNIFKSRTATLLLLQSIALSSMFGAPTLAQGVERQTAATTTDVVNRDKTELKSKIALVQSPIAAREWVVPLTGKAVKVQHSLPTYKEIENYSYDLGGNLPGAGI